MKISLEQDALTDGRTALETARDTVDDVVKRAGTSATEAAKHWKGSAGTAAQTLVAEWSDEMARLTRTLNELGNALRAAELVQVEVEYRHEHSISSLHKMMGSL